MNLKKTYLNCILLGILALTGCNDHDEISTSPIDGNGEIVIMVRLPQQEKISRTNPTGGEDGDGREQGILNENTIHDVSLFFYSGFGINNLDSDIPLTKVFVKADDISWSEEDLIFEKKIIIRLDPEETDLRENGLLNSNVDVSFITVVNGGEDFSKDIKTLGDLLAYDSLGATWSQINGSSNAAECDNFVMSTAYETDKSGYIMVGSERRKVGASNLTKTEIPTSDDFKNTGWYGETTVQRMCARVDVMYNESNLSTGAKDLKYTVSGNGGYNTVYITNILPVNVMSQPSYLISKITSSVPTTWDDQSINSIWGGVELTDANQVPANYVIEPTTLLKSVSSNASQLQKWYGSTCAENVKISIAEEENGKIGSYYYGDLSSIEYNCNKFSVICYANENTQPMESFSSNYLTGLALRSVYVPVAIYYDYVETKDEDGNTIMHLLKMPTGDYSDLSNMHIFRYSPSSGGIVDEKNSIYFLDYRVLTNYAKDHPEDNARITPFESCIYADEDGNKELGIRCYYNLWLRHYNDESADPQLSYPMEYAIVRNNIYRVALSFSGPGDPTPTMREPDTMQARIFVRKWNQRVENTPLEF